MVGAQGGEGCFTADVGVEFEIDAAVFQPFPAAEHDLLFQLEAWNAVDKQAADAVMAVINCDLIALLAQSLGCGEAGRAGADDADGFSAFLHGANGLHPALLEGGVGDVAFNRADGDGFKALFDDAVALAQPVLRADAAANLGKCVGCGGKLIRFLKTALGGELQPVRDVVGERAVH